MSRDVRDKAPVFDIGETQDPTHQRAQGRRSVLESEKGLEDVCGFSSQTTPSQNSPKKLVNSPLWYIIEPTVPFITRVCAGGVGRRAATGRVSSVQTHGQMPGTTVPDSGQCRTHPPEMSNQRRLIPTSACWLCKGLRGVTSRGMHSGTINMNAHESAALRRCAGSAALRRDLAEDK